MRQIRSSGSVEGVMGDHDSYSDSTSGFAQQETPGQLIEILDISLVPRFRSYSFDPLSYGCILVRFYHVIAEHLIH